MVPFYFFGDKCITVQNLHLFQEQKFVCVRLQEMTKYNSKNLKIYLKMPGGPN